jgi:hypothetical protein
MLTLTAIAVTVAALKFAFDGVTVTVANHVVSVPHTDGGVYAAFLSPILGTHGFMASRTTSFEPLNGSNLKPEDPDGE